MVRRSTLTPLRENLPPTMLDLPDGRRLAYHEYGDPAGTVILNCHGGLVSGIDVEYSDEPARTLGLRIISPNRPGVGGTSRLPGHQMLDWARTDVTALLASLGVERFSVLGWSEGGQFALAVAHEFATRVDRVAIVAGALPLAERAGAGAGGPGADPVGAGVGDRLRELNATDRRLIGLARRAPELARIYFRGTRVLARLSPPLLAWVAAGQLGETDSALLLKYSNWFARTVGESVVDTRGSVDEYVAFGAPWGFAPEDVRTPVVLFQGDTDRVIPAHWSRTLAERLPNATLHEYPGEGHFIALTRRAEVLTHLAPSPPA
ncbi:alpha/beta fold hydrolase [Subtercola boreus]|uniref:AB hydrolase-1 domain-containing protein n=1 Tax=Subtercola boreus TaxID=120213 RepID=A0A3E0WDK4_9MICO|nr:alpha/beta hydrolase [Subtercola boreus]RFA21772.1 hypothetical protein B7R24_05665 [Subtercola boreus]RFA21884.1 hypothetical protein B7R23_05610 [Subtercola boreus]RFA27830.1 hypothetical protein B7R25_05735 [Subtercola boreus]